MKTLDELKAIKERTQLKIQMRGKQCDGVRIVVGMATCGIAAGARPVLSAFTGEIAKRHLENVSVTQTGCVGICQYEPIVEVYRPGEEKVTYVKMTAEKAVRVVNDHIVNGNAVTEFTIGSVKK